MAKTSEKTPDLTSDEMLEILKDIARSASNQAARIAAIKELRAMQAGEEPNKAEFARLYEVGKPANLRTKAG